MRLDDILQDFLSEAEERFQMLESQLVVLERRPDDAQVLAEAFRALHSLKGTCGFLGFRRLGGLAHAAEEVMARARDGRFVPASFHTELLLAVLDAMRGIVLEIGHCGGEPAETPAQELALQRLLGAAAAGETPDLSAIKAPARQAGAASSVLRVQSDVFDNLLALGGEIALLHGRMARLSAMDPVLAAQSAHLARRLQEEILRGRLQPVMGAWQSLPRLVRDMAASAGRKVRLETAGGETLLDRKVMDVIRDPIAHMVRNCLAHGIEKPEERRAKGKAAEGVICLSAVAAEGEVLISISDDGRGLDMEKIRRKAAETGVVSSLQAETMSDDRAADMVFSGRFSTLPRADDMAGRGIGLGAVRARLAEIGGTVTATPPVQGQGAVFEMRVPLTLAMIPAVGVISGGQRFIFPRSAVKRFLQLPEKIETAGGAPVIYHDGAHVPLLCFPQALQGAKHPSVRGGGLALIARAEGRAAALAIEDDVWTGEAVVNALPEILRGCGPYLGYSLTSDGCAALVIDARRLLMFCGAAEREAPAAAEAPAVQMQRLLVFDQNGSCAVPVDTVDSVQRLACDALHRGRDGEQYFPLRGAMIPLLGPPAQTRRDAYVVILHRAGRKIGLACGSINGVSDIPLHDATPGSRFVDGQVTDILDVAQLFSGERSKEERSRRVLLVDDSPFFCRLLVPVLEHEGFRVDIEKDAEGALRLRDAGVLFDLIISDIEMPGMDGFSFARSVRAEDSAWRQTPLVALSAHATRHDERRGRAAGFDAFVVKFDPARLVGALSSLGRRA